MCQEIFNGTSMDLSKLEKGIYILETKQGNQFISSKLMKE